MRSKIFAVVLLLVLSASTAAAEFLLGVGIHMHEQDAEKNFRAFRALKVNSIRDDLNWRGVEKARGILVFPQKYKLYADRLPELAVAPLVILNYGNDNYDGGGKPVSSQAVQAFADFAGFSAAKLSGKANHYEIWNEWDNSKEPRSAESYLALVKSAAPPVRAANRQAVILAGAATSAGMRSGWVEALVRQGVLNYADGISIHPYVHCEPDKSPEAWIAFVGAFAEKLQRANGGKEVPLYITEMGWPSHQGACGSSPETVARYAARSLLLARTVPSIRGFWWYDLKNDGQRPEEKEHNFGLMNFDYGPKPAFAAFRDIAPLVRSGKRFSRLSAPRGVVLLAIEEASGARTFAVWTDNDRSAQLTATLNRKKGGETARLSVGSEARSELPLPAGRSRSVLAIDGTPQLLFGADSVVVEKLQWND
ncbi:MAG: hypothetical protein A2075_02730 [Geobacteraceae bacterium GWC2_58_44]|nr:MAG: hypothetical protein A2075_02730 [Geobacteraceae bacterium GWC2_58_44]HBG05168.1 hypothetical protein [Geobacter sp.]